MHKNKLFLLIDKLEVKRMMKFLIVGMPSFLLALVLNYVLVEYYHWSKHISYALVIILQISINFIFVNTFVFNRDQTTKLGKQFAFFFVGILALRLLDWLLYIALIYALTLHYVFVQIINVFLFSFAKYFYSKKILETVKGSARNNLDFFAPR